jgi:hypothetical protein
MRNDILFVKIVKDKPISFLIKMLDLREICLFRKESDAVLFKLTWC